MSDTIRAFIAIELSQDIKDALSEIQSRLKETVEAVKWVAPENVHLTLKFLGNIGRDTFKEVESCMDEIAANAKPFVITLSAPGVFPGMEQPRVIWVGIAAGNKEICRLAGLIEEKLAGAGIEKEDREFRPHLTLGRANFLKDKNSLKAAFASLKIPHVEMTASKLALFQSALTREGPIYTLLCESNFIGNGGNNELSTA